METTVSIILCVLFGPSVIACIWAYFQTKDSINFRNKKFLAVSFFAPISIAAIIFYPILLLLVCAGIGLFFATSPILVGIIIIGNYKRRLRNRMLLVNETLLLD